MSLFRVENVSKTFGDKNLLKNVSFTIEEKDRIGLIGVNGTGKSTLLKVLADIESPEDGKRIHANNFSVSYLAQDPQFEIARTVNEEIFFGDSPIMIAIRNYEAALLELEKNPEDPKVQSNLTEAQGKLDDVNGWDASTVANTILTKLGIPDGSKQIMGLSGGEKKRVAIAKALIQPVDLLLLDEPTNHLDHETIEWLEKYLVNYSGAIVLITHDRYFLNRVTTKIYELEAGTLYQYEGNYQLFLEKKAERESIAVDQEAKRKNLLKRELAWLHRGAKARTTKQKARIQRVENLKGQEGLKEKEKIDVALGSTRLGSKVIEMIDVEKKIDNLTLIKDFSYLISKGDRIGIIGPNGAGKSTLLNIMAERLEADSGEVIIGETVKVGYYTQDHSEMDESLMVVEYIKETAEVVRTNDNQWITAEQMLERFLFPRPSHRTKLSRLSGGERRRLYLLKVLMEEPNVLFLDEPTNDLDTETLSVLEDYLESFPGVVITVSHDRYFLDRVVEKLLVFQGEGKVETFYGAYHDWLDYQTEQTIEVEKKRKVDKLNAQKKPKKLSYSDQQEWNTIEDRILTIEANLENIKEEIILSGSDFDLAKDLYHKQQQTEEDLESALARWEELSILVDEAENK